MAERDARAGVAVLAAAIAAVAIVSATRTKAAQVRAAIA